MQHIWQKKGMRAKFCFEIFVKTTGKKETITEVNKSDNNKRDINET
jgi:hypothetical protein